MAPRSIYERALGDAFEDLHPKIQRRFGFDSDDGVACVGRGTMDEVTNGGLLTAPFLHVGTLHNLMFPETGRDVPFTIRNYAYEDSFGREAVTWVREFDFDRTPRFDATMVYSERRDGIVDYLGTHQHLAVDIDLSVDEDTGGLALRAGPQRVYIGGRGGRFPSLLTGQADVLEWYDDEDGCYRISVSVDNPLVGRLFGYRGRFDVEWLETDHVPDDVLPTSPTRRE